MIGLTGASQSGSELYVTGDGGVSFKRIEFPMSTVTELPAVAEEYGYTLEDFYYIQIFILDNTDMVISAAVLPSA